jgi:hypothetical protein
MFRGIGAVGTCATDFSASRNDLNAGNDGVGW